MKNGKVTAVVKACYADLMEKCENPVRHACDVDDRVFLKTLFKAMDPELLELRKKK